MKEVLGNRIKQIRGVSYKPTDLRNAQDIDAIPILRANNITNEGIDYSDLVYVSEKCIKAEQLLKPGDILICASSGSKNLVGKASQITSNLKCSFGAFCKVIRAKDVEEKFLGYFFQSSYYRKTISESAAGANINNIRAEDIDNIKVNFPEKTEQQEIAKKFIKTYSLINKRKQQLKKLDLLVKSQFIEMFGICDLRSVKSDWKKIGAVAEVVGGSTPRTEQVNYWGGNHPWITPAEISDDSFIINSTTRMLTDDGVKSCSLKLLPVGTVLLSSRAPIGKVAIAGVEMYCNQGFKNLICNKELNSIYVYCLLKFNVDYLNSLGRGATFKEISKSIVDNISIPVPPIEKQNAFARFVEQTDKSKFRIKQSLEKLEICYKALLQKYFG